MQMSLFLKKYPPLQSPFHDFEKPFVQLLFLLNVAELGCHFWGFLSSGGNNLPGSMDKFLKPIPKPLLLSKVGYYFERLRISSSQSIVLQKQSNTDRLEIFLRNFFHWCLENAARGALLPLIYVLEFGWHHVKTSNSFKYIEKICFWEKEAIKTN